MLRKDVKIGLGIGGALLAVLIVYLLATDTSQEVSEVTLADDPPALNPTGGALTDRSTHSGSAGNPNERKPEGTASNSPTGQPTSPGKPENTSGTGDKWSALDTGKLVKDDVPLLMPEPLAPGSTKQPGSDGIVAGASSESLPADPQAGSESTGSIAAGDDRAIDPFAATTPPVNAAQDTPNSGSLANGASAAPLLSDVPATQPAGGRTRTHVVQSGETFASIAQVAYGNSAYYPHILRANPSIDPKKLRPGTTIVLPDISQVVSKPQVGDDGSDAITAGATHTSIDATREYRVMPSDSLYKISLRLYGRADKVDAIYNLNKDLIGPNPSRLRAGAVLKLPEPPTSVAQRTER